MNESESKEYHNKPNVKKVKILIIQKLWSQASLKIVKDK